MKYILITLFTITSLTSCKKDEKSVLEAFDSLKVDMEQQALEIPKLNEKMLLQIRDSAIARPEKYAIAYNQSVEFHEKTETLHNQIGQVKQSIEKLFRNDGGYAKMDKNADSLLFTANGLSATGLKLKTAIENYNTTTEDQLYFYPRSEKMAQEYFNWQDVQNKKGEIITYMDYNYKGYPSIATVAKLSLLQQNALNVENAFLHELLENPEH